MTCILNSRWYFCLGFDGVLSWWLKPLAVSCKPSCHSLMFPRWLGCELLRWKRVRNCPSEELAATWNFWRLLISSTDVLCSILPVSVSPTKLLTKLKPSMVYIAQWDQKQTKNKNLQNGLSVGWVRGCEEYGRKIARWKIYHKFSAGTFTFFYFWRCDFLDVFVLKISYIFSTLTLKKALHFPLKQGRFFL